LINEPAFPIVIGDITKVAEKSDTVRCLTLNIQLKGNKFECKQRLGRVLRSHGFDMIGDIVEREVEID